MQGGGEGKEDVVAGRNDGDGGSGAIDKKRRGHTVREKKNSEIEGRANNSSPQNASKTSKLPYLKSKIVDQPYTGTGLHGNDREESFPTRKRRTWMAANEKGQRGMTRRKKAHKMKRGKCLERKAKERNLACRGAERRQERA